MKKIIKAIYINNKTRENFLNHKKILKNAKNFANIVKRNIGFEIDAFDTEIFKPYLSSKSRITPFVQPNPFYKLCFIFLLYLIITYLNFVFTSTSCL